MSLINKPLLLYSMTMVGDRWDGGLGWFRMVQDGGGQPNNDLKKNATCKADAFDAASACFWFTGPAKGPGKIR